MLEELLAAIDNAHNMEYIITRINQHIDELTKEDIVKIIEHYYDINYNIFEGIL